jgi:hypothetical protein
VGPNRAAYGRASSMRGFTIGPTRDQEFRHSSTAVTTLSAHKPARTVAVFPQPQDQGLPGGRGRHTAFPCCLFGLEGQQASEAEASQPVRAVRTRTGPASEQSRSGSHRMVFGCPAVGTTRRAPAFHLRGPLAGRLTTTPREHPHGSDDGRARTGVGGCL